MPSNNTNAVALISAFITGACTIVAAIIAADAAGAVHISGSKPSPSVSVKTVTATPAGGAVGISNPPPAPSQGTVLRHGTFTITQGYCVDLDSKAPNWGTSDSCATDSTPADIRQIGNVAVDAPNGNNHFSILSRSQDSSLSTCLAATAYVGSINVSSLHRNMRFCVHTTSGNEALLQVRSVASDLTSVRFAAVVWKA